jgi:hypothetical protein
MLLEKNVCLAGIKGETIEAGSETSVSSEISVHSAVSLRLSIHLHTRDADGMALFAPSPESMLESDDV